MPINCVDRGIMEQEIKEERAASIGREIVLYEVRHHVKGDLPLDSSPPLVGSSSNQGLLSYLSLRGVSQLQEWWYEHRRPRAFKRRVSLFVSPGGEHVAVAAENRVTILHKDNDYTEPCGFFTCADKQIVFTNGSWLEPLGILAITDDLNTLYFIRSNGTELTRSTRSQLKLSTPIVGLVVQKDFNSKKSCMFSIYIITSDGLMHYVEITKEPDVYIHLSPASSSHLHLPHNITCLDFHPDLCLVAVVCANISVNSKDHSGNYSLHMLRITASSDIELVVSSGKLEGAFASPKECSNDFCHPKVSISPQGKYVATLDFLGCVDVFKLDIEGRSLSLLPFGTKQPSEEANNIASEQKMSFDVVDITWWADHILILANLSGEIFMYDILNCVKVSENDPIFCMPLIENVKCSQGFAFLLENSSSAYSVSITAPVGHKRLQVENGTFGNSDKQDISERFWSLMSFSGRSISEMYTSLIKSQNYQAALEFASKHNLDTDEVFKAQWSESLQGIHEIKLYLSQINDLTFILSECVTRVGTTEENVQALLSHGLRISDQYDFSNSNISNCSSIWNIRILRLQLLQFRDRLETFLGINMGRFSGQEYGKFRSMPLTEAAVALAESSKIGALNLLFKRHPYSISPKILDILSSIPETVPVESYCQLLPGTLPPRTNALREADWVECEEMLSFLNSKPSRLEKSNMILTENLLKLSAGCIWPSVSELSSWYKNRAKDIDTLSGQLNNCLALVECGCHNGILELQHFAEDVSYLHQIIYSDDSQEEFTMGLVTWEQLPDYEKFKIMLKGVKKELILKTLQEKAIPFMQNRPKLKVSEFTDEIKDVNKESFLVRWLKELAAENCLEICLLVIENGCGTSPVDGLFKDEAEIIETALDCIYSCTLTDQWIIMASILSKLPRNILRDNLIEDDKDSSLRHAKYDLESSKISFFKYDLEGSSFDGSRSDGKLDSGVNIDKLEKRLKAAEGHVEVGRLMAHYQVPKPVSFFLSAHSDEKNVKQIIRLILSKFSRQPARSDDDWTDMWHDLLSFQEKAFSFLELEYLLMEFIRGLLKAGKFSLARNYLKGTPSVSLTPMKAENLVIQAAKEYFYSASSLSCSEIWKAKECLSLFPSSKSVKAEADVIDALTVRLPNLGVTVLPVQFKQIRNPMEIINKMITSQTGAYLNVEEIIEIAKLLGLSSPDDIAAVEEAIAREAAVAGDLPLAFDLCLVLVKKGHGSIWDLCAAIARGPHIDNMDLTSRKQLLGFALSHCDDESIGELLNAWKEVDTNVQSEHLNILTGASRPELFNSSFYLDCTEDISDQKDGSKSEQHGSYLDGDQVQYDQIKDVLAKVGIDLVNNGINWDIVLRENKRVLSFVALELPRLLELSQKEEYGKLSDRETNSFIKHHISIQMRALLSILSWMAEHNIAPRDDMIKSLAKFIMEPPIAEEDDALGCSFLLNLADAFHGVEIFEEQLERRKQHQEILNIMNLGMKYCSLNNAQTACSSPEQRRNLLLQIFHMKQTSFYSDEKEQIDKLQSTFWKEWETKLEEQKRLADQARELERIMPGTETARFLSRDMEYIKAVLFSFIDSVKLEKKHILKDAVKLADAYGLSRTEVILHFFACALVSEHWGNSDILAELSEFRSDIIKCAGRVIDMICRIVYPEIDGYNKERLSYIYGVLSACYLHLRKGEEDLMLVTYQGCEHIQTLEHFKFYKVLEQECQRVSSIKNLDFKKIASLDDLNFEHFNEEICNNINEHSVEALAELVKVLVGIYDDSQTKGLISMEGVYRHHVLCLLASLEGSNKVKTDSIKADEFHGNLMEIELNYHKCMKYVQALSEQDISYILGRFCTLCYPDNFPSRSLPEDPAWKDCLLLLLTFWIKVVDDFPENLTSNVSKEKPLCMDTSSLLRCLKVFKSLVVDHEISANQGWSTVSNYVRHAFVDGLMSHVPSFIISMIFSGCSFNSIAEVCYEAELFSEISSQDAAVKYLLDLYVNLVDKLLADLSIELSSHQNLHHLLSSLSRLAGNYAENLKIIRLEAWAKLRAFSDNTQLASRTRLYALQLMQCVTGINLKSLPSELVSVIEPWEGWDDSICTKVSGTSEGGDISSSVTSNLVALKCTQLIAVISPDIEITPENLMTLDSAVSCFIHISESVTSIENLRVLQVVLEEWEEFFSMEIDIDKTNESPEESNNWSSEEWDDGWEEELVTADKKNNKGSVQVRPLHACWMEIIKRLIGFSELHLVMELLDKSLLKSNNALLDEDEAHFLLQLVAGLDCFMALKLLVLLPYEAPRLQCLRMLESNFKTGKVSNASCTDNYELLAILLSSGLVRNIAIDSSFSKVFSYICYSIGLQARNSQEDLLNSQADDGSRPMQNKSFLFIRVLLPFFISELVCGGQPLIAGFIVLRWMHTHICLSLIDVVETSLRRYLEQQILQLQSLGDHEPYISEDSSLSLAYTYSCLRSRLHNQLESALQAFPESHTR